MVNVTDNGVGYKISNINPQNEVSISIKYDKEIIPKGYTARDIQTFYFDKKVKRWTSTTRNSVDLVNREVSSTITKNGEYINGIIRAPEAPETEGYAPTTLKNIKAADPSAGIQTIDPPSVNQQGSAALFFDIETPPGRQGIEPKLRLTYNSDGAGGWLGEGWNLNTGSIVLDTRWGVPQYKKDLESETYLYNGAMLAMLNQKGEATEPHRDMEVKRQPEGQTERQFYLRREGSFNKIIRHGTNPKDYVWELINKNGIRYTYGGQLVNGSYKLDPSAVLRDPSTGNIAEWKLVKVEDLQKNYMLYFYHTSERTFPENPSVKGYNIYLDSCVYTRSEGYDKFDYAVYTVKFTPVNVKDFNKLDVIFNARYGFLTCNSELLGRIDIGLYHKRFSNINDQPTSSFKLTRSYAFNYASDPVFAKTILKKITQYGEKGNEFYHHDLVYYDYKIDNKLSAFGRQENWSPGDDGLSNNKIFIINNNSTALGGSNSATEGFSFYTGFGSFDWKLWSKSSTGGAQGGYTSANNEGLNALVDLDGDNLPDKVFVESGSIKYRKNLGNGFFGAKVNVQVPVGTFSKESSSSTTWGVQQNFFGFTGVDFADSKISTSIYFADVNGDGLIDLVVDGKVLFNHIEIINGVETPTFTDTSSSTPVPINTRVIAKGLFTIDAAEQKRLIDENPLNEVVKVWEAPYTGFININAPVNAIRPNFSDLSVVEKYQKTDGVIVSIQKTNAVLWKTKIGTGDFRIKMPSNVKNIKIKKGERIYFRVQSGINENSNGAFDNVNWDPEIIYKTNESTNHSVDAFGKNANLYKASSDYLVSNNGGFLIPQDGKISINGNIIKGYIADSITAKISIVSNRDTSIIRSLHLGPNDIGSIHIVVDSVLVKERSAILFNIESDENLDLSAVKWKSHLFYIDNPRNEFYATASYNFRGDAIRAGNSLQLTKKDVFNIRPSLKFSTNTAHGNILFTLRKSDTVIGKQSLTITSSNIVNSLGIKASLQSGDSIFVTYEGDDPKLMSQITSAEYIIDTIASRVADISSNRRKGEEFEAPFSGNFLITPYFIFKSPSTGTVSYQVRKGTTLQPPIDIPIDGNTNSNSKQNVVSLTQGEKLSVVFNLTKDQFDSIVSVSFSVSPIISGDVFAPRKTLEFGPMFRNWGQFVYNGMEGRAANPINEALLKLPEKPSSDFDTSKFRKKIEDQIFRKNPSFPDELQKYSPFKAPFSVMVPFADAINSKYVGGKTSIFVDTASFTSSRLGLDEVRLTLPYNPNATVIGSDAWGIEKRRTSSNTTVAGGAGFGSTNISGSGSINISFGSSKVESDFLDINGDRFPDILSTNQVQTTNPLGGLEVPRSIGITAIHESSTKSGGIGIGGGVFPHPDVAQTSDKKATALSGKTYSNNEAAKNEAGKAGANFGFGVSGGLGSEETENSWVDINADGLLDKVDKNGNVLLNLGKSFIPVKWNFSSITNASNTAIDPGVTPGFSTDNASISGGIGLSNNSGQTDFNLQDINGDGLTDKVFMQGNTVYVAFNTGTGFLNPIAWEVDAISKNSSSGLSLGGSFTIGIPIPPPFPPCFCPIFKLVFSTAFNTSFGIGRTEKQIADIDADGCPDFLRSSSDKELLVKLSTIGKINKLKEIKRPLGGSFVLDYKHNEATYNHPGGKWVLDNVKIIHGVKEVGDTTVQTFTYLDGKYDRFEREFLGFGKIATNDVDKNGKVFRKRIQTFDVSNYHSAGNLLSERVEDALGIVYSETVYTYYNYLLSPKGSNYGPMVNSAATPPLLTFISFTPLKSTQNFASDSSKTRVILNESSYTYDSFGNVDTFKYSDKGHLLDRGIFDYKTVIKYKAPISKPYLIGLPEDMQVTDFSNKLLRHVTAQYNAFPNQPSTKISRISKFLNAKDIAVTDFEYEDRYGNLKSEKLPANSTGQRMKFLYTYDEMLHTHIVKVTDAHFGLFSAMDIDYRFGHPVQTTDIHSKPTTNIYDEFGRINTIIGPEEHRTPSSPSSYTIKFEYHPEAVNPYAITTHFDTTHPADGIKTINFIDGYRRSIQIKKTGVVTNTVTGPDNKVAVSKDTVWLVSGRIKYDPFDRIAESYYPTTEKPYNDIKGAIFDTAFDAIPPTRNNYDVLDRTLTTTLPNGDVTSMSYGVDAPTNSLHTVITDARSNKKDIFTNGSDLKSAEVLHGPSGPINTKYEYDPVHQLTKVFNPNHPNTTIINAYDIGGRRTSYIHPDADTTFFEYDPAGNITSKYSEDSRTRHAVNYTYEYNRLIKIDYPNQPENNVKYEYGIRKSEPNDLGRMTRQEDGTGVQEFTYGNLGQIEKVKRVIIAPFKNTYTFITDFKYDSWNRLLAINYPDGDSINYIYNVAGTLEKVIGSKGITNDFNDAAPKNAFVYAADIGYDKFETRNYIRFGNGTENTYQYDTLHRLETLSAFNGPATSRNKFINSTYSYDPVSNITDIVNHGKPDREIGGSFDQHFGYDVLNRLASATGEWRAVKNSEVAGYTLGMQYDDLFNITGKKLDLTSKIINTGYASAYLYNNGTPHQLTELNEKSYRLENSGNGRRSNKQTRDKFLYDSKGNDTTRITANVFTGKVVDKVNERKILWDDENRIRTVSVNGFVSNYTYDADGERVIKLSTEGEGVYFNVDLAGRQTSPASFSLYANPYFSVRSGDAEYTKHIYIEGERITSKLISGNFFKVKEPVNSPPPAERLKKYDTVINKLYNALEVPHAPIKGDAFIQLPKVPYSNVENPYHHAETGLAPDAQRSTELELQYWYHTNHLGSTNYVTGYSKDGDGPLLQYIENLPFGEAFIEQRTSYSSQFLFNGKEQDQETGLYYYGARYYDPKSELWLGIDREAERHPDASPYIYARNNPVILFDPNGADYNVSIALFGLVRVAGGVAQTSVGAGLIVAPEPLITKAVGVVAFAHGVDDISAGLKQVWTGESQQNLTYTGVKAGLEGLGVGESDAAWGAGITDIFAGFLGALGTNINSTYSPSIISSSDWAKTSGIVRDALAKTKGNYGLGATSFENAFEAGESFVGKDFSIRGNGNVWMSANELRQFRLPSSKFKLGVSQANFEWRNSVNEKGWQGNGHLDIIE